MDSNSPEVLDDLVAAKLDEYQLRVGVNGSTLEDDEAGAAIPETVRQRIASGKHCIDLLRSLKPRSKAADSHVKPAASGGRCIGPFEVLEEIGSGGFGIVYRARDPRTDREVALKIPRIEVLASPDLQRRFEQEARAAAKLDHPYIVPVLEAGSDGLLPYIASAYCHGMTLARWLAEQSEALPPRFCAELIEKLALAMSHAHGRGVLHRDLKPGNVILAAGKPDLHTEKAEPAKALVPRITDFGLARLADQQGDQTKSGALLGTPAYMAPEQAIGRSSDIGMETDVYGLGTILYEMLTGRPPLRGLNDADTIRQVCFEEPVPPRRMRREIPRDLEAICLHCLEKKPSERYSSAQALADDLRRYLDGLPTLVRPLSPPQMLWRWSRRKPAWAALVVLLIAASAAIAAVFARAHYEQLQLNQQLREQRTEAETHARHANELAYSADMQLASKSWEQNNINELQAILDRYKPKPGQIDLRGDEWHYLRAQLQEGSRLIGDYGKPAHGVQFSPDGSLLATTCKDGKLRIYEMPIAKLKWTIAEQGNFALNGLRFSPDGKFVAACSDFGRVLICDMTTGTLTTRLKNGHVKWVADVDFSPDGELLASAGADGYVVVWDWKNGTFKQKFLAGKGELRGIRFTQDGKHVITTIQIGPVKIWNLDTQSAVATLGAPRPSEHGEDWARGISLSPDRMKLAAGWEVEGGLAVYDISNVAEPRVVESLPYDKSTISYFITNNRIAVASANNTGHIWALDQSRSERDLHGHRQKMSVIHGTPDGAWLATSSIDGTVRLWSSASSQQGTILAKIPGVVTRFTVSPRGDEAAFGLSQPYRMAIVNLRDGSVKEIEDAAGVSTMALAYSQDGAVLAACQTDTIRFTGRPSGELLWEWTCPKTDPAAGPILIDELTEHEGLMIALEGKNVWVIDYQGRKVAWRHNIGEGTYSAKISPDHRYVYLGDQLGRIHELNAADGSLSRLINAHQDSVNQIVLSKDGRFLVSGCRDRSIQLWDRQQGKPIRSLVAGQINIDSPRISPDNKTLMATQDEYFLSFWSMATGQRLVQIGPWGNTNRLVWNCSPDRRTIYAAVFSDDVTILRAVPFIVD